MSTEWGPVGGNTYSSVEQKRLLQYYNEHRTARTPTKPSTLAEDLRAMNADYETILKVVQATKGNYNTALTTLNQNNPKLVTSDLQRSNLGLLCQLEQRKSLQPKPFVLPHEFFYNKVVLYSSWINHVLHGFAPYSINLCLAMASPVVLFSLSYGIVRHSLKALSYVFSEVSADHYAVWKKQRENFYQYSQVVVAMGLGLFSKTPLVGKTQIFENSQIGTMEVAFRKSWHQTVSQEGFSNKVALWHFLHFGVQCCAIRAKECALGAVSVIIFIFAKLISPIKAIDHHVVSLLEDQAIRGILSPMNLVLDWSQCALTVLEKDSGSSATQ